MTRIRIAVADDDTVMRVLLAAAFSAGDFELVGTASNGAEAVRLVGSDPPDVLVVDLEMPELDGLEVARVVRREHPGVGIVLYSGAAGRAERAEHVDAVIAKSRPVDELLDAVRRVASRPAD